MQNLLGDIMQKDDHDHHHGDREDSDNVGNNSDDSQELDEDCRFNFHG